MDDIHGAHSTAGVIEHPFLLEIDEVFHSWALSQLVDNVLNDRPGVVTVGSNTALGEIVEMVRLKDVERLESLLREVNQWGQDANDNSKELEPAEAAARRRRTRSHDRKLDKHLIAKERLVQQNPGFYIPPKVRKGTWKASK
jgi:hypothetical protein